MSDMKAVEAEVLAVNIKFAKLLRPILDEADGALIQHSQTLVEQMRAVAEKLPDGQLKSQCLNVVSVCEGVKTYFKAERDRLDALISMEQKSP